MRKYVSEFIGTLVLVLFACGVTFPSLVQRAANLLKNKDIDAYNYSCGTFMAVDLYQHNIKFMRLGADIDTVGVRHRGLSLNYLTGELFGSWS